MTDPLPIAVVPILVNVGAAVLPAIIGSLASAAAVLVRPRELIRLCRRKPHVPALAVGLIAGAWFLGGWLGSAPTGGRPDRQAAAGTVESIDWASVAVAMIQRQQLTAVSPTSAPASRPAVAGPTIFRTDPARCGWDGGPAPRDLVSLWKHVEPDAMYLASPAVVGKWVYGASCVLDPPSNYGSVFCLDAATGKKRWLTEFYDDPDTSEEVELKGFFSSPAVTEDGKYLVIGQGLHYDTRCSLLCFDTATGELHWRVNTPLHLESSPVVRGDLAVIGVGAVEDQQMKPVGDPGYVLGVRISDGKVLWRHGVNDPESSPAIGPDGVCYIGSGFNGSELVALRTQGDDELKASGGKREVWRAKTPYPATGAVTLLGELVVIGCGNGNYVYADPDPAGSVIAFDAATGRKVWEVETPDAVLGAVAAAGGLMICPVRNGEVLALRAADPGSKPTVAWRTQVSGSAPILAATALAGKWIYAVSKDGYLAVLRAADGRIVEKHYINDENRPGEMGLSISSPTVAGGRVFVGSETGGLRCYAGRRTE